MGIELNTEQLYAVMDMESWYHTSTKQCYEISGAAGTGKTTLVMYLIERLELKLNEVLFVAYMGKAATQLARNHLPAKTIHSAIYDYEYGPALDEHGHHILLSNGKWKMKGEFVLKERLPNRIKLIVVDEGGMVPKNIALDLMSFGLDRGGRRRNGSQKHCPGSYEFWASNHRSWRSQSASAGIWRGIFSTESRCDSSKDHASKRGRSDHLVVPADSGRKTVTTWSVCKLCGNS